MEDWLTKIDCSRLRRALAWPRKAQIYQISYILFYVEFDLSRETEIEPDLRLTGIHWSKKMLNHIVIRESQVKLETNVNHTVAARVRVVMKLKAEAYNYLDICVKHRRFF